MTARRDLSPAELATLRSYAAAHGRTWKAQLLDDWRYARTPGLLQVLRNALGPSWLISFRLPAEAPPRCPWGCGALADADGCCMAARCRGGVL